MSLTLAAHPEVQVSKPVLAVFLIWPVISLLQLGGVLQSALKPGEPTLRQDDLSALTLANLCATCWLLVSSNSLPGALPFWSLLALPFVPLLSGYPLRRPSPPTGLARVALQTFSSFTTLASFLALAVEMQHGGRLPLVGGRAELAAAVFVGLTARVVSLPRRSLVKRIVNVLALSGILVRRLATGGSLLSLSLGLTAGVWAWAVKKLVKGDD